MAIVEVFLGAILTVLLDKPGSGELLKFLRCVGIDAQLKGWRRTLLMIQAVLTDAENKQTTSEAVKEWLNDLEIEALPMGDHLKKLLSLRISGCPLLKKRCLKNKGDYWSIIADIPDVQIYYRSIYDPCP